jgi:hypothetical protein
VAVINWVGWAQGKFKEHSRNVQEEKFRRSREAEGTDFTG